MNQHLAPLNRNNVKFGVTPTLWWNDDFLDIDIGISFGQCISEMALAGFAGCSIGHKYPTDKDVLLHELRLRGLQVSEPWASTYFTIKEMHQQTVDNFVKTLKYIKSLNGTDIVVAELGGAVHQQPVALFANRPIFDDRQWDDLVAGLNKLGKIAKDEGMRLCYHHHMGTGVQIREEIDRLLGSTNPDSVHLLLDTGHFEFAGGDPLKLTEDYIGRIKHVHLKNVRQAVKEQAMFKHLSFKEAILAGIFTVPGDPDGCIDFGPIMQVFSRNHYSGWLVVEAEQDPAKANPLHYAKMARGYLHEVTGI